MAERKKPKAAFSPPSSKQPRSASSPSPHRSPAGSAPSYNFEHPSWRISKIEMMAPFGWHIVTRSKLEEIRTRLGNFESMTWNQILIEGKKQHHSVEVWRLCKEARARLEATGLGDTAQLVSLSLSGQERIWGLRQGVALLVLWWDPEHEVCPSLLKHT